MSKVQMGNDEVLGDPEVTASIYCKLSNLPNKDMQYYSTDLRELLGHPVYTREAGNLVSFIINQHYKLYFPR